VIKAKAAEAIDRSTRTAVQSAYELTDPSRLTVPLSHRLVCGLHPYRETAKSGQLVGDAAVERFITLNSRVGSASISAGVL
jgi:hypothetical protein